MSVSPGDVGRGGGEQAVDQVIVHRRAGVAVHPGLLGLEDDLGPHRGLRDLHAAVAGAAEVVREELVDVGRDSGGFRLKLAG